MDKETLSNYGWIVICVMVIAVMIALATPFGTFIKENFEATTNGLIQTNNIVLQNVTLSKFNHDGNVPYNAVYYTGVDTVELGDYTGYDKIYAEGEKFPDTICIGDVYVYGDYEYRYGMTFSDGQWSTASQFCKDWGARVLNNTKETYTQILHKINGAPITSMIGTYAHCENLKQLPDNYVLPSKLNTMGGAFWQCTSLKKLPTNFRIPSGVKDLFSTFDECTSLEHLPEGFTIPEGVLYTDNMFDECFSLKTLPTSFALPSTLNTANRMFAFCHELENIDISIHENTYYLRQMFIDCFKLSGTIEINTQTNNAPNIFGNVNFETQEIYLSGTSPFIDTMGNTGIGYCSICNGHCHQTH